jgi:hypothetical protein
MPYPDNSSLLTTMKVITYISGIMYYMSTTINPFLYNIMSLKFRAAFKVGEYLIEVVIKVSRAVINYFVERGGQGWMVFFLVFPTVKEKARGEGAPDTLGPPKYGPKGKCNIY